MAWHVSLAAEYLIEKYVRIASKVAYFSEFRNGNIPLVKNIIVFIVSQSVETFDSIEI
jgi:glucosamine 6-phosphate synthetase-like amidotransferase/phosphosugar isomerase protein